MKVPRRSTGPKAGLSESIEVNSVQNVPTKAALSDSFLDFVIVRTLTRKL